MKLWHQPLSLRDVLPSALGVALLGLALCWTDPPGWSVFGKLGWWALPLGVLMGCVLYCLGYIFTCSPKLYTRSMQDLIQLLHNLFKQFSWFDILLISCLAGIGEELLVRGVLQAWLIEFLNPWSGILIASIVFGLMHNLNKVYVVLTAVLGCLFGLALYLTESILCVIVAHTVYDVLAFFMIVKRPHRLGLNSQNENFKLPIREQP